MRRADVLHIAVSVLRCRCVPSVAGRRMSTCDGVSGQLTSFNPRIRPPARLHAPPLPHSDTLPITTPAQTAPHSQSRHYSSLLSTHPAHPSWLLAACRIGYDGHHRPVVESVALVQHGDDERFDLFELILLSAEATQRRTVVVDEELNEVPFQLSREGLLEEGED